MQPQLIGSDEMQWPLARSSWGQDANGCGKRAQSLSSKHMQGVLQEVGKH